MEIWKSGNLFLGIEYRMPNAYMVRITHSYQDASGVVALWAARCEKMVVYEHVGTITEKVHIHLVMKGSETHKKQLRNIGMATGLDLKGNKNCSFKEWNVEEERPCVYMTKGKHDPSFVKGYTLADAQRWKSLWEDKLEMGQDAKLYKDFVGDWSDWLSKRNAAEHAASLQVPMNIHWEFEFVRSRAKQYAFTKCGQVWNQRTTNIYKMLVYTYVMREGITIPDKHPVFKEF